MPCGAWSEMDPAMLGSAWMGAQLMRGALASELRCRSGDRRCREGHDHG
jgi:hypothetical protein